MRPSCELFQQIRLRHIPHCPPEKRNYKSLDVFTDTDIAGQVANQYSDGQRRYPVLLVRGLLQSAGPYYTNDDDSLAFFLCNSGYDVWLGNNRYGFEPRHTLLQYHDPRMWAWNIRQVGVMDLPALISRVLSETGFAKLGLVSHSQGTTESCTG
jgi:pimeloyl-ACP methyl ester carboxylesterase